MISYYKLVADHRRRRRRRCSAYQYKTPSK